MKYIILVLLLVGCSETKNTYVQQSPASIDSTSLGLEPAVYTELNWVGNNCSGLTTFAGDFSIYSNFSGSFFNSVQESIFVNEADQTVELLTNGTGNMHLKFSYEYIESDDEWEITYGPNCSRRYRRL